MLESNELGTVSEFNVFLATMRWVDADKSREQFLDEILGLVRFPTMDYEELGLVGKHPTAAGAAILKVGFRAWGMHKLCQSPSRLSSYFNICILQRPAECNTAWVLHFLGLSNSNIAQAFGRLLMKFVRKGMMTLMFISGRSH